VESRLSLPTYLTQIHRPIWTYSLNQMGWGYSCSPARHQMQGAEERRLRRMSNTPQRGATDGNTADDTLPVNQGSPMRLITDTVPHDLQGVGNDHKGLWIDLADNLFKPRQFSKCQDHVEDVFFLPRIPPAAFDDGKAPIEPVKYLSRNLLPPARYDECRLSLT
jgi:hypothetical protein